MKYTTTWFDEGYDACYEDADPWDCPYKKGTDQYNEWQEGYETAFTKENE